MRIQLMVATLLFAAGSGRCQQSGVRQFYAPSSSSGRVIDYEVQPGETLFHIAERFLGDPYQAESLAKANGISDPLRLKAGAHLRVPAQAASLRYSILRLSAEGDPVEYGPEDTMLAGDRFLLRLAFNTPGYVYLFNRSENGSVARIFPSKRQPQKIQAFSEYLLPVKSYFQLDRMRGDEEIWAVLASEPLPDLDAALDSGVLGASKMQAYTSSSSEKGIVISSDDSDDEVIAGNPGSGRLLVVHQIKIRRR
jgi:hypothetical protein